ncbi:MAG: O-acetylhomoserine aminocarboxypropyltransferase/cysteine synthase family protein [Clostridia bacterium]
MKFDTKCVQGAYNPQNGGARVLPLYQSTTFAYDTPEQLANVFDLKDPGFMYTRLGNPTVNSFEEKIAMLENGVAALATSSGQAATLLAVTNVCNSGDNVVCLSKLYGGTFNLLHVTLRRLGIDARFVDPNASPAEIEKLIDDKTKLIFGETLANPAMDILDFDKFGAIAKKFGILLVVDNTLATPYLVRPLEKGANIVVHSTTKYIDGHASCVGGMIVCGDKFDFTGNPRYPMFTTPDESYHGMIYQRDCGSSAFILKARAQLLRDFGTAMSPFNAFLTNIGCETLHVRMQRHCDNALAIAKMLQKNPNIDWVSYAGLEGDRNHEKACKYFEHGFGGMITFGIKGGRDAATAFMKNIKLIKIVTHIADVRTCLLHPASTTHRQMTSQQLIDCGISDSLVRLSVGIEDVADIIADLENALKK